jgi:peptidase M28-like protein
MLAMPAWLKVWIFRAAGALLVLTQELPAQTPLTALNPTVQRIVDGVSAERIEANLRKLESFGTRYILSEQDSPQRGIGAAKRWIHDEFQSYSPKLQVSDQNFRIRKGAGGGKVLREVELANVIAVLPGTVDRDSYVLVTAHYDTQSLRRKPRMTEAERLATLVKRGMDPAEARRVLQVFPTEDTLGEVDAEATAAEKNSPGVVDDASGTAAVMELARVMSQYTFEKTLVFVAFAGEEIGLEGSKVYAADARKSNLRIEAVLNNDIIGSDTAGNGRSQSSTLRAFAAGPEDSPGRALLRYTKLLAEHYVPSMNVEMVFHGDRFNRGGDHTSFQAQGYAAVRLTTASENYKNQHSPTDTLANASVSYTTRVTRMNAAVAASLALAPPPPVVNYTFLSGDRKGDRQPMLSRGKSGYDAALRWQPSPAPDLAGYAIVIRSTTAPDWEREIWVGNVTSYTLPDVSIDNIVLGVKAVDRDGNQSLVSAYLEPVSRSLTAPPAAPVGNK